MAIATTRGKIDQSSYYKILPMNASIVINNYNSVKQKHRFKLFLKEINKNAC